MRGLGVRFFSGLGWLLRSGAGVQGLLDFEDWAWWLWVSLSCFDGAGRGVVPIFHRMVEDGGNFEQVTSSSRP